MKKTSKFLKTSLVTLLSLSIVGCASMPKGFLKPSEDSLAKRQLQSRQYDTTDETKIITSVAGVLQDLGFTLDDSESDVGFVAASKKADATNKGQIFLMAIFGGLGNNPQAIQQCDNYQVIKVSVITKPALNNEKIVVRVTFQRIVWNMANQINRVETIKEPEIYQKFYDRLSKSIFLEAQEI